MAKRERTTGNNSFVAHRWSVNKEARSGSMKTHDGIGYSYRTPIARTFEFKRLKADKEATRIFFITSENYSPTTAKHKNEYFHAIPYESKREIGSDVELFELEHPTSRHDFSYMMLSKPSRYVFSTACIVTSYHFDAEAELKAQVQFTYDEYTKAAGDAWKSIQAASKNNKLGKLALWYSAFRRLQYFCQMFRLKSPKLPESIKDIQERYDVYIKDKQASEAKKQATKERKAAEEAELRRVQLEAKLVDAEAEISALPEELKTRFSMTQQAQRFYASDKTASEIQSFIWAYQEFLRSLEAEKRLELWESTGKPLALQRLNNAIELWRERKLQRYELDRELNPPNKPYGTPPMLETDLLRVNGNIVETSRSADVPLEHVKAALKFVLRLWRDGKTYEHGEHTVHIGHFRLQRVAADMVEVGCHRFSRAEIERLALELKESALSEVE